MKNIFSDKVEGSMCAKFQVCIVFCLARRRATNKGINTYTQWVKVVTVTWQNFKKMVLFFFTNCLIEVSINQKMKKHIRKSMLVLWFWGQFWSKNESLFYREMSVFETSKYLLIVRFWSSITYKRIFLRNSLENRQNLRIFAYGIAWFFPAYFLESLLRWQWCHNSIKYSLNRKI